MHSSVMANIALAGTPNCGKTALFNALTGSRQKVANYAGVTVEKKEGWLKIHGKEVRFLDLPGAYSLQPRSPDEEITRDILVKNGHDENSTDLIVAVVDATSLERGLSFVLELKSLGKPIILALNMIDLAKSRGLELDIAGLERELQIPVIATIATKKSGIQDLIQKVESVVNTLTKSQYSTTAKITPPTGQEVRNRFNEVDRVLKQVTRKAIGPSIWSERIDHVVTHPVYGVLLLVFILVAIFQAVFSWASGPQDMIERSVGWLGQSIAPLIGNEFLRGLLVDGVIAGVGSVVVFLPQILILFTFVLLLEDSGYLARAAFLMDKIMSKVGLHGRAFIPLLSSFACAIPGIMATRTIENRRDRLTTILIAPLMTCSARLPVYTLLIAAFIPNTQVFGPLRLQGLVMVGLYFTAVVSAIVVALILKLFVFRGEKPPLLMELPTYKIPSWRNLVLGLLERAKIFLRRAGTVILSLSIILWLLASFPRVENLAPGDSAIQHSYAGMIGKAIEPVLAPLGFDWRVSIALIPGFAAREVMVSALGTVYAIEASEGGGEDEQAQLLGTRIAKEWSLATALSLLVWYIFAPQCLSTLAVARRETNSWKWAGVMMLYMLVLAYLGSWMTFQMGKVLGIG